MEATLPGHRTMSPCPVWEKQHGRVYLFFICVCDHVTEQQQILSGRNAARLCVICSEDHGCSWGKVRDLTSEVIGSEVKHWATFAVGPGHGIQLQSGRLVIPAYAYYITHWCCHFPVPCTTKSHSLMIYSDDLGATWHHGQFLQSLVTGECQVADLTGKTGPPILYCSARTLKRYRAEAVSTDNGESFQRQVLNQQLLEPPHGCQGSVVSFQPREHLHQFQNSRDKDSSTEKPHHLLDKSQREAGTEMWLLFSHPTSKTQRVDLGIYLNQTPLEATSWSNPWVLHWGPSGYSDLAAVDKEGLFGCLFECGIEQECEKIGFRLFTDQEILSHVQTNYPN